MDEICFACTDKSPLNHTKFVLFYLSFYYICVHQCDNIEHCLSIAGPVLFITHFECIYIHFFIHCWILVWIFISWFVSWRMEVIGTHVNITNRWLCWFLLMVKRTTHFFFILLFDEKRIKILCHRSEFRMFYPFQTTLKNPKIFMKHTLLALIPKIMNFFPK